MVWELSAILLAANLWVNFVMVILTVRESSSIRMVSSSVWENGKEEFSYSDIYIFDFKSFHILLLSSEQSILPI